MIDTCVVLNGCLLNEILPAERTEARKGANESSAISTLRTLVAAQTLFRDGDKDGDGEAAYAYALMQLQNYNLIDAVLSSGIKSGYQFSEILAIGDYTGDPPTPVDDYHLRQAGIWSSQSGGA